MRFLTLDTLQCYSFGKRVDGLGAALIPIYILVGDGFSESMLFYCSGIGS